MLMGAGALWISFIVAMAIVPDNAMGRIIVLFVFLAVGFMYAEIELGNLRLFCVGVGWVGLIGVVALLRYGVF